MHVGVAQFLDEEEVHRPPMLLRGLSEAPMCEETGEDVARRSPKVNGEAELRVARSQFGGRALSNQVVEATGRNVRSRRTKPVSRANSSIYSEGRSWFSARSTSPRRRGVGRTGAWGCFGIP
jgi:hypothetical protein